MNILKLLAITLLVGCTYQKEAATSGQDISRAKKQVKVNRKSKIIGEPKIVHIFRSKSKDAIMINIHYYATKGGASIKDKGAYLVIAGKKYPNLVQDGFRTGSQIAGVDSYNEEIIFFKDPHDIPNIPKLDTVQFTYSFEYNGQSFEIDEMVKVQDVSQEAQKP